MDLPIVKICPLGSKCQEARDGKIYECEWFTHMRGTNPNTGLEEDRKACAMSWIPILLVENAGAVRSTSAAVESFRNEMKSDNEVIKHAFPVIGAVQKRLMGE